MRLLIVFMKTLREFRRDLLVLLAVRNLRAALRSALLGHHLGWIDDLCHLVVNQDQGAVLVDGRPYNGGAELIASIGRVAYADGQPMIKVDYGNLTRRS